MVADSVEISTMDDVVELGCVVEGCLQPQLGVIRTAARMSEMNGLRMRVSLWEFNPVT